MSDTTSLRRSTSVSHRDPRTAPITDTDRADARRRFEAARASLPADLRALLLPRTVAPAAVPVRPGAKAPAVPTGLRRRAAVVAIVALGVAAAVVWIVTSGLAVVAGAQATEANRVFGAGGGLHTLDASHLPLPYVLLAATAELGAFVGVAAPWLTAAATVTVLATVLSAVALHRAVLHATDSRPGARIAAAAFLLGFFGISAVLGPDAVSPAVAVTTMFVLATVAGLAGWATSVKPYSGGELAVFCGLPAAAAMLSGFGGWILAAGAAVTVGVAAQKRWGIGGYSRHLVKCYLAVPAATALLLGWFSFRWSGDPLAVLSGGIDGATAAPGAVRFVWLALPVAAALIGLVAATVHRGDVAAQRRLLAAATA